MRRHHNNSGCRLNKSKCKCGSVVFIIKTILYEDSRQRTKRERIMNSYTEECPTCDGCSLVHDTKDYIYTYNDIHIVIPNVVGHTCRNCGEVILDAAESKRVMLIIKESNKERCNAE